MIHSFLLIGQSNMAGRGHLEEAMPINTDRIYTRRNGRFQEMFRPICPDREKCGVNLAESFAEQYAKRHDVDVGLVCCADGGTMLEQWLPGSLLYDNTVANVRLAQRSSKIMGVLWHQGESDCKPELSCLYKARFKTIMASLRKDLGLADVPFLLGGLGDYLADCAKYPELKNYPVVNGILQSIARDNPMTAYVSAEGLPGNSDNLHFSSAALYDFGLRYLDAWETFGFRAEEENIENEHKNRSSMERL